jgi:rare lipoprotein A
VASLASATLALFATAGCHRNTAAGVPNVRTLPPAASAPAYKPPPKPTTEIPAGGVSAEDLDFVEMHKPIASQTGNATWYAMSQTGHKAADGMTYDNSSMTAAHRTLPLGSLIKVTNLKTQESAVVRITDRGPFVEERVLDLTVAAARAAGIYRAGWAPVRIDVYSTPKPISIGGRWCVQIGPFLSETEALRMKAALQKDYKDAQVNEFSGEKNYWVRIRPLGDNRKTAEYIASHLHPVEGRAYLTRLD